MAVSRDQSGGQGRAGAGDLLAGLNEAQRAGVLHEGSPLIVLAGPGTGKTRLITRRVAHQVRDLGIDPATIVAVTFTNRAAGELRERLAQLIGPASADSVHAYTFHGLGLRLLRRFGDLSGVGHTPEIIDSAQRRRLLRELISGHRPYGRLISHGAEALLEEGAAVIERLVHNALDPARVAAFAEAWGENLGRGLGSEGQEIDEIALAAEREERERFAGHARLFGLYEEARRERGWLTIDDLITLPTRLLREHGRVRAICRHEFRHFVVDEFQDVNLAQIEFVRALAPPGDAPDLVVVGDDDQAIYEFRGADDRAFARFAKLWPAAETLALTENYRSQVPVLEAANAVIARAGDRFAPEKRIERAALLAGQPVAAGAGVELIELGDDLATGEAIASMVGEEIAARPEGELSRVAVIARTHTELDRVAVALEIEGIPAERRKSRSVAEEPGVRDLLAWVELLVNPTASWSVRRVLSRPPIGVASERLSAWERGFQAARRTAEASGGAGPSDYAAWLREHAGDDRGVARFLALRDELLDMAQHAEAAEVVWTIATRGDLAHADLPGGRDRARRVESLVRVVRFVRGVQHRLGAPGDLAAFWSYYNDLDDRDRGFGALGEELVEQDEEGGSGGGDAVQLLTAHGAKGLEFDVVFVPRVSPPHGYPKTAGGTDGVSLPAGLVDRLGDERTEKERVRAEERRIFYVAATRAERRLVLFTKRTKGRSKSEHFAQELVEDLPRLVTVHDGDEVLAGGGHALHREASPALVRETRRRASEAERRAARADATAALASAERAGAGESEVAAAAAALRDAAERLAVASSFDAGGTAPAWVSSPEAVRAAARLEAARAGESEDGARGVLRPMRPPLDLSFTLINDYKRCPACCYVKHVLGLGEAVSAAVSLGSIAHQALERHSRAWQEAEAEGGEPPTLEALLEDGRGRLLAQIRAGAAGDGLSVEELASWLTHAHEMMAADGAEILEVERRIVAPYEVDGVEHRLVAKLDRVDRTDAGVRIVDYKTGQASKAKLEPSKSDLQLGIYAIAIRSLIPDAGGVAEYWMLRTGQRGTIGLDAIDEARVRKVIDGAVAGMTAGRFPSTGGRDCAGLCAILGDGIAS